MNDPEVWGYPIEPLDNYDARGVRYERIPDIINALFIEGKIINKTLYTDITSFKNKVKKHKKYNLIVKKLTEFGFEISGFEKGSKEYTMCQKN